MKNSTILIHLFIASSILTINTNNLNAAPKAAKKPVQTNEQKLKQAVADGKWVALENGKNSLHALFLSYAFQGKSEADALEKARAILKDAKKKKGDLNSVNPDSNTKALDLVIQYYPGLVEDLRKKYGMTAQRDLTGQFSPTDISY